MVGGGQVPIPFWPPDDLAEQQIGLVPASAGVTLYAGHLGTPVLRRYDVAGALVADTEVPGDDPELVAATAVRRADGSIVSLVRRPTSYGRDVDLVRSTDELLTTEPISTVFEGARSDAVLLQRPDGALIVAAGIQPRDEIAKAAYVVSTDGGQTWTAPRLIRPDGGNGQSVIALALDGDGGLIAVVGENNSMRGWFFNDLGPFTEQNDVLYPPPIDHVIVRIADP